MNFFKKFEKLKVKYKTNKKRILSITVTAVGIACLLIGSSMAYLLFEASGTTQTISAGTLQLSYTNESEAIILNNAVPQSDEQGLNNNVYSITLTNTSTIKSYYELSLNNNCTVGNSYTVNGSSVTANVCIPNNYIKVAVKTNKDEDYTIKNGGNVILKGYLEAKENISFEIVPEKTILEKAAAPIQKILSGKTEKEQKNRQGEKENRHFAMLKWIVIGSIITILLIMAGVVLCRRKKDSAKEEQADEE